MSYERVRTQSPFPIQPYAAHAGSVLFRAGRDMTRDELLTAAQMHDSQADECRRCAQTLRDIAGPDCQPNLHRSRRDDWCKWYREYRAAGTGCFIAAITAWIMSAPRSK